MNASVKTGEISLPRPQLPKGGGAASGIGETFQTSEFSGTAGLSIPIHTTACRGFEPHLSLDYSSGSGNSIFGFGFGLEIPDIARKTERGFPNFDDNDTFLFAGADDLVPCLEYNKTNKTWVRPTVPDGKIGSATYLVTRYRPRTEGLFARIEKWTNTDLAMPGDTHWRVTTKDNITSVFGPSKMSRIADPNDETRVFKWLLETRFDAKGNRIDYDYTSDDIFVPEHLANDDDPKRQANRYVDRIKYGHHLDEGVKENWHFEVVFDYGERDGAKPDKLAYEACPKWRGRLDPFSNYRAGFEVRTQRLCRNILMFHRFGSQAPFLVSATHLDYRETNCQSHLSQVTRTGYRHDEGWPVDALSMPPLSLEYSKPETGQGYAPLLVARPGEPDRAMHQRIDEFTDLYGDGLPGILHYDGPTVHYSAPLGDGRYDAPEQPAHFPIDRSLADQRHEFVDLDGDGKLDLVVHSATGSGFYKSDPAGRNWEPFQSFSSYPVSLFPKNRRQFDATGDGRADLVDFEAGCVRIYPSLGPLGFGPATVQEHDGSLPETMNESAVEYVGFADLVGDGGSHLIRIRRATIEYWPHLGHGKFGRKRVIPGPDFGTSFDPGRLHLIDIDGSGTPDLVYAQRNQLDIYRNQSGNGFSPKEEPAHKLEYDNLDHIRFADVLGNGTSCLVLTSRDEAMRLNHRYYDFNGGVKPHLLVGINNNKGTEKKVHYATSTKFHLDDLKAGKPWASRLSFPVHVAEAVEIIDHIAGSRLITRCKYHDGYYDPVEREFRGFGYVERWDSETFEEHLKWIGARKTSEAHGGRCSMSEEPSTFSDPVYTRSWFHTGAPATQGGLSDHYRRKADSPEGARTGDYYREASSSEHDRLPDSALEHTDAYHANDLASIAEAQRALHGQKLREEVYGTDSDDHPDQAQHPFVVTESNFTARLLQPRGEQQHAVCFFHPAEEVVWHYERDPTDPRIEHNFTLDVDDHGHIRKSLRICYPRRKGKATCPQQTPSDIVALVQIDTLINTVTGAGDKHAGYVSGVPCERKTYEIGGLKHAGEKLLCFSDVAKHVDQALHDELPFEKSLQDGAVQARLLSWQRHHYWNQAVKAKLPLGQVASHALHHHSENAVFSVAGALETFDGEVTSDTLRQDGKYILNDSYCWNPGLTRYYLDTREKHYLPTQTVDPFERSTTVKFDAYGLVAVSVTDALENETSVEIDYHTLQPFRSTDANGNVSEVLFDPLATVALTSDYFDPKDDPENSITSQRAREGDAPLWSVGVRPRPLIKPDTLADPTSVAEKPSDLLHGATTRILRQLNYVEGKPPHAITLLRENRDKKLLAEGKSPAQISIVFFDGFGRPLQKLAQAEKRDEAGRMRNCWLKSGLTVYNNKGNPVRQYEPSYVPLPDFDPTATGVSQTTHYDPLQRVSRVTSPDGFFSIAAMTAWEETHSDANDTYRQSPFFKKGEDLGPDNPAIQGIWQSVASHSDTPQSVVFDTMGRPVQTIERLRPDTEPVKLGTTNQLVTQRVLDILGNELSVIDPRGVPCFTRVFGMDGAELANTSKDAGDSHTLHNAMGLPIHVWDDRGFHVATSYDALHRPTEIRVHGGDDEDRQLDHVVERMVYGDTSAASRVKNQCGRLIEHWDQAGLETYGDFDMKGKPRKTTRQFRKDYQQEPDWRGLDGRKSPQGNRDELDQEDEPGHEDQLGQEYVVHREFDALGRVVRQTHADTSVSMTTYNAQGWLSRIEVVAGGPTHDKAMPIVEWADYDASGKRTQTGYANGVTTQHRYDPNTHRLIQLRSTSAASAAPGLATSSAAPTSGPEHELQNIRYVYDPVGNIIEQSDAAQQTIFFKGEVVEPRKRYQYDALYRLTGASGREHIGQVAGATTGQNDRSRTQLPHPGDGKAMRNYCETYRFDDAGNIRQLAHRATAGNWIQEFSYQGDKPEKPDKRSNRLVSTKGRLPHSPELKYGYDSHGNMTEMPHLPSMKWDWRNQLKRTERQHVADDPSKPHAAKTAERTWNVYDWNGQRVRQITQSYAADGKTPKTRKERIYLGDCEIYREYDTNEIAQDSQHRTLHITDGPTSVAHLETKIGLNGKVSKRLIRYKLCDHLGSCSMELDDKAQVISYEEYTPFGSTSYQGVRKDIRAANRYRYAGKERDEATGLYYYGARYYAPWLGRWTSPDPAGSVDGPNLYAFVRNNPIRYRDAKGLMADDERPAKRRRTRADKPLDLSLGLPDPVSKGGFGVIGKLPHQDSETRMKTLADVASQAKAEVGPFAQRTVKKIGPITRVPAHIRRRQTNEQGKTIKRRWDSEVGGPADHTSANKAMASHPEVAQSSAVKTYHSAHLVARTLSPRELAHDRSNYTTAADISNYLMQSFEAPLSGLPAQEREKFSMRPTSYEDPSAPVAHGITLDIFHADHPGRPVFTQSLSGHMGYATQEQLKASITANREYFSSLSSASNDADVGAAAASGHWVVGVLNSLSTDVRVGTDFWK